LTTKEEIVAIVLNLFLENQF